ncbi:PP2C family protein-serine/threonine phosphatase [Streptomyces sp. NPDC058440]|uniref:PP2C family protein-serine/threonine phosphatase n=1 Tax=Streptomyces sp. NPDC058440 TaxID=3346501 RepID=UPI0036623564
MLPITLAGGVLTVGVALNLSASRSYAGLPLIAAAPLMVAPVSSFLAGAILAFLASALSFGVDLYDGRPLEATGVDLAGVTLIGLLALLLNKLIACQRKRLSRSQAIAAAVQRAVVPPPPRRIGSMEIAASYSAAQTGAQIGGDLYAVQETRFGTRGLIADVRGKGTQAVEAVAVLIGAFRQEADRVPSLIELGDRLDGAMVRHTQRSLDPGKDEEFATAVLVEVTPDHTQLSVVNRGHPAPYLVDALGIHRLDASEPQTPLGLGVSTADWPQRTAVDSWAFPRGATLLLVTDGVTEARDRSGAFYDPCSARLTPRALTSASKLVKAVKADVERWTNHTRQDDAAIMALQRVPLDAPHGAREHVSSTNASTRAHDAGLRPWKCCTAPT